MSPAKTSRSGPRPRRPRPARPPRRRSGPRRRSVGVGGSMTGRGGKLRTVNGMVSCRFLHTTVSSWIVELNDLSQGSQRTRRTAMLFSGSAVAPVRDFVRVGSREQQTTEWTAARLHAKFPGPRQSSGGTYVSHRAPVPLPLQQGPPMRLRPVSFAIVPFAAGLLAAAPARAQTVHGTLVDSAGRPVEQVLVALLGPGGRQAGGALTSASGEFRIRAPGAGATRCAPSGWATPPRPPPPSSSGRGRHTRSGW